VRRAGTDRGEVRDAVAGTRRFQGVTGELAFDRWGDVARRVTVALVRGGVFVTGEP